MQHYSAHTAHWSSRSLGSHFQHLIFQWLVRCGGIRPARWLLRVVVFYYTLIPHVRRRCLPYLRHRFGACSGWKNFIHAYRLYLSFGNVLLDRTKASCTKRVNIASEMSSVRALLCEVVAQRRGCIVLTAHVGAWQVGLAALEVANTNIHIVQLRDPLDVDQHYFERGNAKPVNIIDARAPLKAALQIATALRKGEVVAMMGDRLQPWGPAHEKEASVSVTFLGARIHIPIAAYALSSLTGAPLIMVFTVRKGEKICPLFGEILPVPQGLNHREPAVFFPYAQAFAQRMEKVVEAYPYQFFNFYNLWVDTHEATKHTRNP